MQTNEEKRKKSKKQSKSPVRDLKPSKNTKGGFDSGGVGGKIGRPNVPPGPNT
jgi:hypothetical protein